VGNDRKGSSAVDFAGYFGGNSFSGSGHGRRKIGLRVREIPTVEALRPQRTI
jgi:hypothetical protein